MKKRLIFITVLIMLAGLAVVTFILTREKITHPWMQGIVELPESKEPGMIPNDWFARQKIYPNPGFNHEHYLHALRQAEAMHRSAPKLRNGWESAGPYNIGGRITDLAINPDNPSTIYVGAASGGILKTTNNGATWSNIFTEAPVISIGALALDPSDDQVLYAGTGEANSSSQSYLGNGIYKTTDGGATWQHLGLEQTAYFGRIVVDYSNTSRIFAVACGTLFTPNDHRGIYRSQDGGQSWQQVLFVSDSTSGIDIAQHPANPQILYAAMWERMRGHTYRRSHGVTSGIYKSVDGGDTWTLLTNGLPGGDQKGRIGLAIARNNPDIVYAFIDRMQNGYSFATVFKTINGGQNWTQTNDGILEGMNSSFGWYFGQIRVDPQNDQRIFVLGVDMYRSENGGNSYTQISGYFNIDQVYVDNHAMFIHPQTGFIVHGNDGGLYTSANYGNSWSKINNLPLTQFYAIEVDYLNPQRIYGGTQDNNTVRTWTGALNNWERILGGDGFYTLVDYTNSNTIYAESQWGNLYRSNNGGQGFTYIADAWQGDRTNWSSPVAMHPANPSILYFGTYRLWKTTNKGSNWTQVSGDLTRNLAVSGFSTITTIAISNLDPQKILVGTDDGRVHISTIGGDIWSDITSGLPIRWITRVAFDPFDTNTIYVTVSGFRWDEPQPHVFRSSDLGQTWVSISGNLPELPVNVIVADPGRENQLFVGTDAGIYYTIDGGEEWWSLSQGIPNVPVTDLKIHDPTRTLVAGTYGSSAFRLDLDVLTSIEEASSISTENAVVMRTPVPNPYSLSVGNAPEIEIYLTGPTNGELIISDIKGMMVAKLYSGFMAGGSHFFRWDQPGISTSIRPGVYFVQFNSSKGNAVQKIVIQN